MPIVKSLDQAEVMPRDLGNDCRMENERPKQIGSAEFNVEEPEERLQVKDQESKKIKNRNSS